MKKINKHNIFGYKVGYREKGSRLFTCRFKTYTYTHAIEVKNGYGIYNNHIWEVRAIRFSEVLAGIWRENPF